MSVVGQGLHDDCSSGKARRKHISCTIEPVQLRTLSQSGARSVNRVHRCDDLFLAERCAAVLGFMHGALSHDLQSGAED